jgi:hypothetical protein
LREPDELDLALELRPEALYCDDILGVEVHEAVDLGGGRGQLEDPLQVGRERLVRLLVEAELGHGAGLVPTGVVIVAGGVLQIQLQVVVRPDPFAGFDQAPDVSVLRSSPATASSARR